MISLYLFLLLGSALGLITLAFGLFTCGALAVRYDAEGMPVSRDDALGAALTGAMFFAFSLSAFGLWLHEAIT